MSFPKAELIRRPVLKGDGFEYGGGYVLTFPIVQRMTKGENGLLQISNSTKTIIDFSDDDKDTAEMVRDAINEKLERDYSNGGN